MPAEGLRSVTVVHEDGCLAEAAGAALFVAGPAGWQALAARLGLDQVLVLTTAGEVLATPRLAARLQPQPGITLRKA
jgi:thiamine biosynthesis lipoprotein